MNKINSLSPDKSTNKLSKLRTPTFLYQAMNTNLIHLFHGNLVLGSNCLNPFLTILLVTLFFLLYSAQISLLKISYLFLIIPTILYIATISIIIRILTKDPGIIPKLIGISDQLEYIPQDYIYKQDKLVVNSSFVDQIRFCSNCHIYRGSTTFHCNRCSCCILGHDHHCHWLGKCIGKYNYGLFIWFLLIVILNTGSMMAGTITSIIQTRNIWLILVCSNLILEAVSFIYTLQLLIFHIVLIYKGLATRSFDQTKYLKSSCFNFSKLFSWDACSYYDAHKLVYRKSSSTDATLEQFNDVISQAESEMDKKTNLDNDILETKMKQ